MNNEIKQIIEDVKLTLDATVKDMVLLNRKDIKQLLDYITYLQQENERLKKIEKFKFTLGKDETKAPIVIRTYEQQFKDYKSRNEKAYKIIDEALTEQMITGNATVNLIELCAILKGSDKK